VVENGNLQKKVQPYAADKVTRFQEPHPPMTQAPIGPGTYNIIKALPPPPTLPTSNLSCLNTNIEPPIMVTKKKLKETAH
jgi:hypothetical protein